MPASAVRARIASRAMSGSRERDLEGDGCQRAALAARRFAQPVARLQHQAELDQRVGDVGVAGSFDRLVAGDGAAAGALGGGEAARGAQRYRLLVRAHGGASGSARRAKAGFACRSSSREGLGT